jgi:hypothetical protein
MQMYLLDPDRYELRQGSSLGAPLCPYGNTYHWLGFDKIDQAYVRFTKSVFKLLIKKELPST